MTHPFGTWIGRTQTAHDTLTAAPVRLLAAVLDRPETPQVDGAVEPLRHWLYFLPSERQSNLGRDGHPQRGGFLPPVSLPRRMWAGSRLTFHRPLQIGDPLVRISRIGDISSKQGSSGELVFVRVEHEIHAGGALAVSEEQDIVYRDAVLPGATPPPMREAPRNESFSREIHPDPVLLYRYSALTFNGHRIHYDRPYATEEEGYPGLVVHGPLVATLLLDTLLRRCPQAEVRSYSFKAVAPLFDTAGFMTCGRIDGDVASLWARGPQGQLAMTATAELA